MQLAAERLHFAKRLTEKERISLLQIAQEGHSKDITNAFWLQMEAILYADGGKDIKAADAWIAASQTTTWRDYQTSRLLDARNAIEKLTHGKKAWQLAFLYFARSDDFGFCLERLVRHLLQTAAYDTPDGLRLRYATLVNGSLVRENAHSTKTNVIAMNIVELAAFPSAFMNTNSPKRLYTGEITITNNLEKILRQPDLAQSARKIFRNTESWRALTVQESNESDVVLYSSLSVVTATIASAAMAIAAIGTLVWLISKLVEWRLAQSKEIKWPVAVAIAICFGASVYLLTGYLPASFAVALCAAFLTVAPDRSRKVRPTDLGPLFTFMAILLGFICSVLLGTYFIGSTPEALLILPSVGVPSDYLDKPVLAGLSAITFGLVLLIAPFWAIAHRVGTPHVLGLLLSKFGAFMSVMGLTLSVILGPLSVFVDHHLEHSLFQLTTNEPFHYYLLTTYYHD